jgi:hypothetical protein
MCCLGLIVSQALTEFTTPVTYLYVDRFTTSRPRFCGEKDQVSRKPHAVELGVLPTVN